MRRIVYLFLLIVSLFILAGCEINQTKNNSANSTKNQAVKNDNNVENQVVKNNNGTGEIKQDNNIFEKQLDLLKEKLSKLEINSSKITIYYDPNCKLEYCNVDKISTTFISQLGLSGLITKDITTDKDLSSKISDLDIGLPLLFVPNEELNKLKDNIQLYQAITSAGYKVKNGYILPLFLWKLGKENICDDNIDNDKDGKIDKQDGDCQKIVVLYDSRCKDQRCDINNVKQGLKQMFPLGYYIETVDYNTDNGKQMYKELLSNIDKPYLPVVVVESFPVPEMGIALLKENELLKKVGDKYILFLGRVWNPVEGKLVEEKKQDSSNDKFKRGQLSKEQLQKIINQGYNLGNVNNAKILWLEYSDLECPFCARQHNSGNIEYILNKFGEKIAFMFRHFPLSFHKDAKPAAIAAECVGKLSNNDANKYYDFIKKAYAGGDLSTDRLVEIAKSLGIDENKFKQCLKSSEFDDKIQSQMKTGQDIFNISGTPGNVFINKQTGKYIIIPGAYPKETFEKAINELLGK